MNINKYTLLQPSNDFVEKLELKILKIEKEKKNDKIFFLSIISTLILIPILILFTSLELNQNIYLPSLKIVLTAINDAMKYFTNTFLIKEYIEIYKILILTLLIYFYFQLRDFINFRTELK